jgi:FimV-like protein
MSFLFSTMFAHADGLGPIQLLSGLGQPLRANILLANNNHAEPSSACVSAKLVLEDGTFIATPRISLARTKRNSMVYISTTKNINEPAVQLHVEIGCTAPVQRNYQLLLDPANISAASSPDMRGTLSSASARTLARLPPHARDEENAASVRFVKSQTYQTKRADAKNTDSARSADISPGVTLVKQTELPIRPSNQLDPNLAATSDSGPRQSSEVGDVVALKLSSTLTEPGRAEDAWRNEEFRAAQRQLAETINDENARQSAEAARKAEQEKTRLLQAQHERELQQARATQLAQEEKRREHQTFTRLIGSGVFLVACIIAVIWLVRKFSKPKRAQTVHRWKNYQSASDTLIADLSTQTLLDSEFLTTVGENYNTTVFSDTQFEPDTIIDYAFAEESPAGADYFHQSTPAGSNAPNVPTETAPTPADAAVHAAEAPVAPAVRTSPPSVRTSPEQSETTTTAATQTGVSAASGPAVSTKPAATSVETKPESVAATRAAASQTAQTTAKPKASKGMASNLEIKDIADLMQQAEFWMLLQDPFRAIEILEPYRDAPHPESPVPWIYLLDLYRMVGDKQKYESLIARIENIFNAKIPKWDGQFGITPRSLNDFPHVVEKICDLWDSNEIEPYLESLLRDDRDGARHGFDLPVYRNIIQLITLAREPKESKQQEQMRFEKAQAILFSQQIPQLNEIAPASETPSSKTTIAKITSDSALAKINAAPDAQDKSSDADNDEPVNSTAAGAASQVETKNGATALLCQPDSNAMDTKAASGLSERLNTSEAGEAGTVMQNDDVEYSPVSSMETKLELAKAYQEIGEKDGARELLYEVIKDGSPLQSEKAKAMLKRVV